MNLPFRMMGESGDRETGESAESLMEAIMPLAGL